MGVSIDSGNSRWQALHSPAGATRDTFGFMYSPGPREMQVSTVRTSRQQGAAVIRVATANPFTARLQRLAIGTGECAGHKDCSDGAEAARRDIFPPRCE